MISVLKINFKTLSTYLRGHMRHDFLPWIPGFPFRNVKARNDSFCEGKNVKNSEKNFDDEFSNCQLQLKIQDFTGKECVKVI